VIVRLATYRHKDIAAYAALLFEVLSNLVSIITPIQKFKSIMGRNRLVTAAYVTILAVVLVALSYSIDTWREGSSTSSQSAYKVDAYTAKAATYDIYRANRPGWDALGPILAAIPYGQTIVDLGCGTGAFIQELAARQPVRLDAIDTNQAMVNEALQKNREIVSPSQLTMLNLQQGNVSSLTSSFYDVVFCAQILQNLTPDPTLAAAARHELLMGILRILKPGGKLILTTRAVSPGPTGRYADLYWYADGTILPHSVWKMEQMVPRYPLQEIEAAGFVNSELFHSNETVVKFKEYLNPFNLKKPAFRSADSFFQHVTQSELDLLLQSIERRAKDGSLQEYIRRREARRAGNGHVATLLGYKATINI
jgi:ubiquinone/menaquinone biosynthesis C-methylase UbiE